MSTTARRLRHAWFFSPRGLGVGGGGRGQAVPLIRAWAAHRDPAGCGLGGSLEQRQPLGGVKATTGVRDGCKQRAVTFVSGQTFPICAIPT